MNALMKAQYLTMLKRVYDDLTNDRCEADDEQVARIMAVISHRPVSKEVACNEVLHWSRSKFDQLVGQGLMPKGRKVRGFTELRWYEDELLEYKRKLTKN